MSNHETWSPVPAVPAVSGKDLAHAADSMFDDSAPEALVPPRFAADHTAVTDQPAAAATHIELPGLIGTSAVMQAVYARALGCADTGRPVLISGRAGSGKSALARALHRVSQRSDKTCRVMRSITFPDFLSPSLQTRTRSDDRALAAHFADLVTTGTLVLDEIGDLSIEGQTALLQLLQRASGPVNLIALTHMNLQKSVEEGQFCAALLDCLSRSHLVLPNLHERQDDLGPLAERFRQRLAATNREVMGFSDGALGAMHCHLWPGNLRELRNRVERAMLVTRAELLNAEDLGLQLRSV